MVRVAPVLLHSLGDIARSSLRGINECFSNLCRALIERAGLPVDEALDIRNMLGHVFNLFGIIVYSLSC